MKNTVLKSYCYMSEALKFDVSKYGLSIGTHYLSFVSIEKNSTEWVRCNPIDLVYKVVVKSNDIYISKVSAKLTANSFNFTGNKFATVRQPVDVSVKSQGYEYNRSLYFFASTSSTDKGSSTYSTSAAIEAEKSETIRFYFTPPTAGEYHVWVCANESGTSIVGTTTVTINPAPTDTVLLTKKDIIIDADQTTTITVRVKNNSQHDYYDSFKAIILLNNYDYASLETPTYLIKAGETKDITMKFLDIEPNTHYSFRLYYKPYVLGDYSSLVSGSYKILMQGNF